MALLWGIHAPLPSVSLATSGSSSKRQPITGLGFGPKVTVLGVDSSRAANSLSRWAPRRASCRACAPQPTSDASPAQNKVTAEAPSTHPPPPQLLRRAALVSMALLAPPLAAPPAFANLYPAESPHSQKSTVEPSLPSSPVAVAFEPAVAPRARSEPDTTITSRVYFDFSLCPTAKRLDRTLGDSSLICSDGEPLGRVVIGLYGRVAPITVQHFTDMVTGASGSTYKGSVVHRIVPGMYFQAGQQGPVEKGHVAPPKLLDRNPEAVSAQSFLLRHWRPGTVSLSLGENDDEENVRLRSDYRNVEFLVTTGPGPAPQLDGSNIVFGTVMQGMDVVTTIAAVPTFQPSDRIRQFNSLAQFFGDERAAKGRATWFRPLEAIVISDCGVLGTLQNAP